jgi:hypothetical protein
LFEGSAKRGAVSLFAGTVTVDIAQHGDAPSKTIASAVEIASLYAIQLPG